MSVLSGNTWYQIITLGQDSGSGAAAGCPYPEPGYCSVFIQPFNATNPRPSQLWQFVQTGDSSSEYIIRAQDAGPASFLGVELGESTHYKTEISSPRMQPMLDNSTTWTLGTWGDGTYYMYSAANGSDWRLDLQENGSWLYFSSNITSGEGGLYWEFKAISQINDTAYSTIPTSASSTTMISTVTGTTTSVSAATTTTSTFTSTTSTIQTSTSPDSHNSSTNHGLSSYSEAAIGASIGGVAILLILAAALRILLRRKRTGGHVYGALGVPNDKGADVTSSNIYESSSNELSELPATALYTGPAELPAQEIAYLAKK